MKSVKIYKAEYEKIKALAKKRGQFLSYTITEAIRFYLASGDNR